MNIISMSQGKKKHFHSTLIRKQILNSKPKLKPITWMWELSLFFTLLTAWELWVERRQLKAALTLKADVTWLFHEAVSVVSEL